MLTTRTFTDTRSNANPFARLVRRENNFRAMLFRALVAAPLAALALAGLALNAWILYRLLKWAAKPPRPDSRTSRRSAGPQGEPAEGEEKASRTWAYVTLAALLVAFTGAYFLVPDLKTLIETKLAKLRGRSGTRP